MKILVTFAFGMEFAPWRRKRDFRRMRDISFTAFEARVGEADVRVVLTGVGATNTRCVLQRAFDERLGACISSGLAGGLRRQHRRSEILAAKTVRDLRGDRAVNSDPALLDAVAALGARPVEAFCTSNQMILTAEGKQRMGCEADAVEMESFSVLALASERGVPALALRAISDSVDEDLPLDFNQVLNARGNIHVPRLALRMFLAPHRLPAVLQLGRESRRAATALACFLDLFVRSLSARKSPSERAAEFAAV